MSKNIFYSFLTIITFVFMYGCNKASVPQVPQKNIEAKTYEDKRGRTNLIGEVDKASIMEDEYFAWFNTNYENYNANESIIDEIKKPIQNYEIEAYFGTWCGDSKRDIPIFYKILEDSGYNLNRLKIVAVGNEGALYKKSPDGETDGKDITNVPTFIFYDKEGKEVNRIVESKTGASLEEDVMKIVTGQEYKHKYADF